MAFVSIVKALYPYEAVQEDELSFDEDDILYITENNDPDWWSAILKKNGERIFGLVPSNYLEQVSHIDFVRCLFSYQATDPEELSFNENDRLYIYDKTDPDWWIAQSAEGFGFIPSNYCQSVNNTPLEESKQQLEQNEQAEDTSKFQDPRTKLFAALAQVDSTNYVDPFKEYVHESVKHVETLEPKLDFWEVTETEGKKKKLILHFTQNDLVSLKDKVVLKRIPVATINNFVVGKKTLTFESDGANFCYQISKKDSTSIEKAYNARRKLLPVSISVTSSINSLLSSTKSPAESISNSRKSLNETTQPIESTENFKKEISPIKPVATPPIIPPSPALSKTSKESSVKKNIEVARKVQHNESKPLQLAPMKEDKKVQELKIVHDHSEKPPNQKSSTIPPPLPIRTYDATTSKSHLDEEQVVQLSSPPLPQRNYKSFSSRDNHSSVEKDKEEKLSPPSLPPRGPKSPEIGEEEKFSESPPLPIKPPGRQETSLPPLPVKIKREKEVQNTKHEDQEIINSSQPVKADYNYESDHSSSIKYKQINSKKVENPPPPFPNRPVKVEQSQSKTLNEKEEEAKKPENNTEIVRTYPTKNHNSMDHSVEEISAAVSKLKPMKSTFNEEKSDKLTAQPKETIQESKTTSYVSLEPEMHLPPKIQALMNAKRQNSNSSIHSQSNENSHSVYHQEILEPIKSINPSTGRKLEESIRHSSSFDEKPRIPPPQTKIRHPVLPTNFTKEVPQGRKEKAQLPLKASLSNEITRLVSQSSVPQKNIEIVPVQPLPGDLRVWTDVTGTFRVEARYIKLENNQVHLHKSNGVFIAVPLDLMSTEDVEYVKIKFNLQKASANVLKPLDQSLIKKAESTKSLNDEQNNYTEKNPVIERNIRSNPITVERNSGAYVQTNNLPLTSSNSFHKVGYNQTIQPLTQIINSQPSQLQLQNYQTLPSQTVYSSGFNNNNANSSNPNTMNTMNNMQNVNFSSGRLAAGTFVGPSGSFVDLANYNPSAMIGSNIYPNNNVNFNQGYSHVNHQFHTNQNFNGNGVPTLGGIRSQIISSNPSYTSNYPQNQNTSFTPLVPQQANTRLTSVMQNSDSSNDKYAAVRDLDPLSQTTVFNNTSNNNNPTQSNYPNWNQQFN